MSAGSLRISAPATASGKRARIVAAGLGLVYGLVALKGVTLSLSSPDSPSAEAGVFVEVPRRADIVDRNGELLATTVEVNSLYADPRAIWDPAETAARLAEVLDDVDPAMLAKRLGDRSRAFVWVKRQLTPRQRQAVFDLGLEGLGFRAEPRRAYPKGELAGHLLGETDIDGNGVGGVELAANDRLIAGDGALALTLDAGVQFVLEAELDEAITSMEALGGAGIIVAVETGEIRALASWPAFNPNRARDMGKNDPRRFNRATTGVYELGSVFKPLTVAAALDAGAIQPDQQFDVSEPIDIGGETIGDLHPVISPATVTTIVSESSNIGTVKIAGALGAEAQINAMERFGLLSRPAGSALAGAAPMAPATWSPVALATASYGHGLAVSPLAFSGAFAALGNGGARRPLSVLQSDRDRGDAAGDPVVSAAAAEAVVEMLRETVTNGTGRLADVPGYRVAGKTGTAEKVVDGRYDATRNLNSFAALFPADRPEYAILIVLDEAKAPKGADGLTVNDTAATTAAPLAGRVIARAAPLLGVMPRWDDASEDTAPERRRRG